MLKMSALKLLQRPIYVINSVDNTKLPCYTPPLMQHLSFFRNLPPFFILKARSVNYQSSFSLKIFPDFKTLATFKLLSELQTTCLL